MSPESIEVRPLAGAVGAEIGGVDLRDLSDDAFARVREALLTHGAVFFRDQTFDPDAQIAFARRFGEPEVHPIVEGMDGRPEMLRVHKPAGASASFGVGWHTDNSFFERPSLGSVLYGETIPPVGGDTLYASMEAAYQALSPRMQSFLGDLRAVHSASRAYDPDGVGREKYEGKAPLRYRYSEAVHEEVEHPVVRTHVDTGARSIYVNPMFTQRICDLAESESHAILEMLYQHCARPDFQCRFRWTPGAVALWDNRQVWHYAMDDYREHERVMYRVTIAGERPV